MRLRRFGKSDWSKLTSRPTCASGASTGREAARTCLIFDVDGTLYRQAPVRRGMALRLLSYLIRNPLAGLKTAAFLRHYRRAQEGLRGTGSCQDQLNTACRDSGVELKWGEGCVRDISDAELDLFPVECVSWEDAQAFLKKLAALHEEAKNRREYRLPSEAEWEYACRGGPDSFSFPFQFDKPTSSLSSTQANFNGNEPYGGAAKGPYVGLTRKVGSYKPNAWGLFDMHGNVAEWCSDFYDKNYYKHSPKADPKGPAKGVLATDYKDFYRVVRGGCWLDEGRACRAAYRFKGMPHDPYRLIGFRVVCEVAKAR